MELVLGQYLCLGYAKKLDHRIVVESSFIVVSGRGLYWLWLRKHKRSDHDGSGGVWWLWRWGVRMAVATMVQVEVTGMASGSDKNEGVKLWVVIQRLRIRNCEGLILDVSEFHEIVLWITIPFLRWLFKIKVLILGVSFCLVPCAKWTLVEVVNKSIKVIGML